MNPGVLTTPGGSHVVGEFAPIVRDMPSNLRPLRQDLKVSHQLFPELRCFVVTLQAGATGRHLTQTLCALFESQPELAGYDLIENLTGFSGDASHADVQAIAACYAGHMIEDGTIKYTVIVTPDENYRFWLPAMDHIFPDRRHLLAPTLEAALTKLNELRGR